MKTVNTVVSVCLVIIWIILLAGILSMLVQKYLPEPEQYKMAYKPVTVSAVGIEKPEKPTYEIDTSDLFDATACCSMPAMTVNERYAGLTLSDDDLDLLAKIVYLEAGSVSVECQQACAEVILNRMTSSRWPNTMNGVIFEAGQFSTVPLLDQADPNGDNYDAIMNALYGDILTPANVVYFSLTGENSKVWKTIDGVVFCREYEW